MPGNDAWDRMATRPVCRLLVAVSLGGLAVAAFGQQTPKVTITGGPDLTGHNYEWQVTNHYTSPIVHIEFPQYRGDTFFAPEGWKQEWKNRAMVGGKDSPGWCRTSAASAGEGIPPGGTSRFGMRIARAGAMARPGRVTVRFADGTQAVVTNVLLPTAKGFIERNIMGIGLTLIAAVALVIHWRHRKSRRGQPPAAETT